MDEINKKVGFALKKISTEQFAIIEDNYNEGENIKLATSVKFGVHKEERTISLTMRFEYVQGKGPFMVLEASCYFLIEENAWNDFRKPERNELQIPKQFTTHLVVLTTGTARGILHTKTENTEFNKYFLPTINVNYLVKEDILLKL